MSTEKDRDEEERDEEERDEEERDGEEGAEARATDEEQKPDPNTPRNRAERRALAKAARKGRPAPQLADASLQEPEAAEPLAEVGSSVAMGAPSLVAKARPKVPPRTMSKGTGDVEGVPEWAKQAGEALGRHRRTLGLGALAVVAVVGVTLGWQTFSERRLSRAASAYGEALQVFRAPVQAEDSPPPPNSPPPRGPRFRTWEARARAAVEKFRRVEQQFGHSSVAPLAKLGEASTLYQLGRYAEAKQLYLQLLGAEVAGLDARVVEGLAFTLESLNDLDGAMQRYRELQNLDDGAHRDRAQYYQARLLARQGASNDARVKELLHGVIERAGRATAGDTASSSSLALRDQALALLRDVDPQDPVVVARDRENEASGHERGGPGGGVQGLPPELQNLIRQMQNRQGGAGGSGTGGPPGGTGAPSGGTGTGTPPAGR